MLPAALIAEPEFTATTSVELKLTLDPLAGALMKEPSATTTGPCALKLAEEPTPAAVILPRVSTLFRVVMVKALPSFKVVTRPCVSTCRLFAPAMAW